MHSQGQTQAARLQSHRPDRHVRTHKHMHTCLYIQGTLRRAHTRAHTGDPAAASDPLCLRAPELFLTHPDRPVPPFTPHSSSRTSIPTSPAAEAKTLGSQRAKHPLSSLCHVGAPGKSQGRYRVSEARKGRWRTCSVTTAIPCHKRS